MKKQRAKIYPDLFKNRYPPEIFKGSDWLKRISPEDAKALASIGMAAHDFGRKGGAVRGRTGKRWPAGNGRLSGRFMKQDQEGDNHETEEQ